MINLYSLVTNKGITKHQRIHVKHEPFLDLERTTREFNHYSKNQNSD